MSRPSTNESSPPSTGCIVVTGAASGIGSAVVDVVLKRRPDVRVGALDIDGDALTALHDAHRDRVDIAMCDVSDRAAIGA